jgi:hypothetical protein
LFTLLINIEWIKDSLIHMNLIHKKKNIEKNWKFLEYL